jgi:hypothetical protein
LQDTGQLHKFYLCCQDSFNQLTIHRTKNVTSSVEKHKDKLKNFHYYVRVAIRLRYHVVSIFPLLWIVQSCSMCGGRWVCVSLSYTPSPTF